MPYAVVIPPGDDVSKDRMLELVRQIHAGSGSVSLAWNQAAALFDGLIADGFRTPDTHQAAGMLAWKMGQADKAVSHFSACLAQDPMRRDVRDALIFALDLDPRTTADERYAQRRAWWALYGAPAYARRRPHTNDRAANRLLRVGYVSADFRQHSAGMAVEGLITGGIPGTRAYCYAAHTPDRDDAHTTVYQSLTRYRNVSGMDDAALAARIRADQIDILVDLSGYTAGNRLSMFCHKPAPVQLTAWGYLPTGLDAMDAWFADPIAHGDESGPEQIVELPAIIPWTPPAGFLPQSVKAPYPVFGAFTRWDKVNDDVLATWGAVLARVPEAVLRCKGEIYQDPHVQAAIRAAVPRVEFVGGTTHRTHLAAIGEVDVMLEPFPQGGGVTTCEALWMGVPSVTLQGSESRARVASALLTHVGATRGIATTREGYIDAAVALMRDRAALEADKQTLRARLLASPICTGYREAVSAAYRNLWRAWCASPL